MVVRHGMDAGVGPVAIEQPASALLELAPAMALPRPAVSEALQQRIDDAIRGIVSTALGQASDVLERHRELLERGAQELLQKETLDEDAIQSYAPAMRGR